MYSGISGEEFEAQVYLYRFAYTFNMHALIDRQQHKLEYYNVVFHPFDIVMHRSSSALYTINAFVIWCPINTRSEPRGP